MDKGDQRSRIVQERWIVSPILKGNNFRQQSVCLHFKFVSKVHLYPRISKHFIRGGGCSRCDVIDFFFRIILSLELGRENWFPTTSFGALPWNERGLKEGKKNNTHRLLWYPPIREGCTDWAVGSSPDKPLLLRFCFNLSFSFLLNTKLEFSKCASIT